MHIEQLEYILEVAKKGTISKAAETLHVSHSAISQSISNLESELGIPIFIRSRSGSICTEEGKAVLKLSYDIMNKITELKELGNNLSLMKRSLSISSSPIFFSTFLPEALNAFKHDYPNIQIEVNENSTESIIESIENHEIDMGFIFGSDETFNTVSQHLTTESLYQPKSMASVSKHSPLAKKEIIYPEDLLQYPLIIRNEKFAIEAWKDMFSAYGKGDILFYSNNDGVIKNVIANNLAVGFTTDLMKYDALIVNGDIVAIPFIDNINRPTFHLICIQAKRKYASLADQEFLGCIKKIINTYWGNV